MYTISNKFVPNVKLHHVMKHKWIKKTPVWASFWNNMIKYDQESASRSSLWALYHMEIVLMGGA